MTSIVKDRPSNTFFEELNYFSTAKETGALTGNEYSNLLISLGSIYANLVRRGLRTEEEAEDFLGQIPNGKWNCYNYPHKDQEFAFNTISQDIAAASFKRETFARQSQPVKRI